jgi:hypothetical protein
MFAIIVMDEVTIDRKSLPSFVMDPSSRETRTKRTHIRRALNTVNDISRRKAFMLSLKGMCVERMVLKNIATDSAPRRIVRRQRCMVEEYFFRVWPGKGHLQTIM